MEYKPLSIKHVSSNLFVYGSAHALVDAICAGLLFSLLKNQAISNGTFGILLILYNLLAFGLQAIFGFAVDYFKSPRVATLLGCILTGIAASSFLNFPVLAVVFAGIGNAMFHVGSGSISLNLTPGKASAPGIFVAPGALGLMVGTLLGKNGQFIAWPFVMVLIFLCVFMFFIKKPEMNYQFQKTTKSTINYFEIISLFILMSIAIRSLVGMVIVFPWKTDINLLIILTLAIVSGKASGGILADRFGWIKVAAGSLLLSIPLLAFGSYNAWLAIAGMFLFNITMPVTLVAISNILPGRPGFAFGLTCLALLIGVLPAFSNLKDRLGGPIFIFIIIIASLVALYFGLQKYFVNFGQKKITNSF